MIHDAILLVGPTGSGKTPLGEMLDQHGLCGHVCTHFDFGYHLRSVAQAMTRPACFTADEIAFLRDVLARGALLEDEQFSIAHRIVEQFLASVVDRQPKYIVLNGLPRHVGQAERLADVVSVRVVVELTCDASTVLARLRNDAGGDRGGRIDDDETLVRRKLTTFQERTAPLVEHYGRQQARIVTLPVAADTTPAQAWQDLERRLA